MDDYLVEAHPVVRLISAGFCPTLIFGLGQGALQALRGCSFGIGTDSGNILPIMFGCTLSLLKVALCQCQRHSMAYIASNHHQAGFLCSGQLVPYVRYTQAKLNVRANNCYLFQGQGQLVIPAVPGIFGHSVDILRLVLKSVLSIEPWLHDPFIVPLPWRDNLDRNADDSLTFGMMKSDGIVAPHPPVARALKMVESAVQDAQYKVILTIYESLTEYERLIA